MDVKNIDKTKKLIERLDTVEYIIDLLRNDWRDEVIYIRSKTSSSYALTEEMRQELLKIARKDKVSIIKQIEAL